MECSKRKKYTIDECVKHANKMKGMCLSSSYKHLQIPMHWQCEFGHLWHARFADILRGGWCPHCAGVVKLTIDTCKQIAEKKNGKCLSVKYIN